MIRHTVTFKLKHKRGSVEESALKHISFVEDVWIPQVVDYIEIDYEFN